MKTLFVILSAGLILVAVFAIATIARRPIDSRPAPGCPCEASGNKCACSDAYGKPCQCDQLPKSNGQQIIPGPAAYVPTEADE